MKSEVRRDRRWDEYSKTALVSEILKLEAVIGVKDMEAAKVEGSIRNFKDANVFVRVWRALRGRIS